MSSGVERVTAAGQALHQVMERVRAGCTDQEGQVMEVSNAIADMTVVTDRIMSAAQDSRDRGRSLAAQSGDLDRIAERLEAMLQGQ